MNKRKIAIGLRFSLVFVYLFLWKPHIGAIFNGTETLTRGLFGAPRVDFAHLWQILGEVTIWPLIICFFLSPLHVFIRAHRWTLLVRPVGKLGIYDSFSLQMVGYLANTVLPLRMGEVVRGVLLAERMQVPKSSALGAVLLERVIDMLSMLLIIMVVSFLYPFPKEVAEGASVFGVMAGIGLVVILFLSYARDPFGGVLGRLIGTGRFGLAVREQAQKFAVSFKMLKQARHTFVIVLESITLWGIYAAQGWMVLLAFHFMRDYPLIAESPILANMVILVLNAVGVSLPSAPGSVGTFHAISIFGLSLFDVPPDPAAGFALVIHALTTLFYLVGGLPFMWREGLHLGELKKMAPKSDRERNPLRIPEHPA